VIGGGDWAEDRLVPDIMRATAKSGTVTIRNPVSTRPWQHVLEPLSGYLLIGQKLLEEQSSFAEAWNLGPLEEGAITVEKVVRRIKKNWDRVDYVLSERMRSSHEANYLKIDCSKVPYQSLNGFLCGTVKKLLQLPQNGTGNFILKAVF